MSSFPMTAQGVQDKLTELYALSDSALAVQANNIRTDFKLWVANAFSLSTAQQTYLTNMDLTASTYYGRQCSICFTYRLPITLVYPPPPGLGYTKWTVTEDKIVFESDGSGAVMVTGSFKFVMDYRL